MHEMHKLKTTNELKTCIIMQITLCNVYLLQFMLLTKTLFLNIVTTNKNCYKEIQVSGFLYAYLELKYDFDVFEFMIYGVLSKVPYVT